MRPPDECCVEGSLVDPTFDEVSLLKIPLRDVASMQCRQPSLEGTGEVPLRRLVKKALRMCPSRIMGLVIAVMETSVRQCKCRGKH